MRALSTLILAAVVVALSAARPAYADHHSPKHEHTVHHHSMRLVHTRIGLATAPGEKPGVERTGRGPYRVRDWNFGWRR